MVYFSLYDSEQITYQGVYFEILCSIQNATPRSQLSEVTWYGTKIFIWSTGIPNPKILKDIQQ